MSICRVRLKDLKFRQPSVIAPVLLFFSDGYARAQVEIYDLETQQWRQQAVHGSAIPFMCRSSLHAAVGNKVYMYGGCKDDEYSNRLYCLDLNTFVWELVKESSAIEGPSAICLGGMVSFGHKLVTFGGVGTKFDPKGTAEFLPDNSFGLHGFSGRGWNNALHEFDTETGEYMYLMTVVIYL